MEFLLLVLIPLFVFILWNLLKDRSEKKSLKASPDQVVEAYMWSDEFHMVSGLLRNFDPDLDNWDPNDHKTVVGLGGLLAMAVLRSNGIDPHTIPDEERGIKAAQGVRKLVAMARSGQDKELATVLLTLK